MSLKNYISKLSFLYFATRKSSFFPLLFNSKKYSKTYKQDNLNLSNHETIDYHLKINDKAFDILMRTFAGDIDIFYEIFWKKMYNIPKKYLLNQPKIIVDLGAHIGFTSSFYALQYPNSKIYSVEASNNNYKLLEENTKAFSNITTYHKAIYSKDGFINFNDNGLLSYNPFISEEGTPMPCFTVDTLMTINNLTKIDLLKIDIEGAEVEILRNNNTWLNKVDCIIIEIHKPYDITDLIKDVEKFGFKIETPNHQNGLQNIVLYR